MTDCRFFCVRTCFRTSTYCIYRVSTYKLWHWQIFRYRSRYICTREPEFRPTENRLGTIGKWSKCKHTYRRKFLAGAWIHLRISGFSREMRDVNAGNLIRVRNTVPLCIVERINGFCKYGLNCVPLRGDNCKSTLLHIWSCGKSAKFHYRRLQCFSSH